MQSQTFCAQPPARPGVMLSPLAEAIIATVSTHMRATGGGDLSASAAQNARDKAIAQFADIGVSAEYLRLFARVILP